jgi:hypothetical protein
LSNAKPPGLFADTKDLLREDDNGVVVVFSHETRLGVVADESSWSFLVGVAEACVRCMTAPKRVLLLVPSSVEEKSRWDRESLFRLFIPKKLVSAL